MNSDDLSMPAESSVLAQIVVRRRRRGKPDRAHARKRPSLRVFPTGHDAVNACAIS
jgi:hypothetical protein